MNISESIVAMLESIGVDAMFTGSGQGSGEILFAFAESQKIKTIMVRHEQAASFMACGYAMFNKGKLGVCNAQGGPGSYNFFSGLGVALSASLPVLSISSYSPKKWRGFGDLGEVTGKGRTPNSQVMFGATTKKTFLIEHPDQVCDILEEAVNLAFEGRPGPVHIDLPYDVAAMPATRHREIRLEINPMLPHPKTVDLFANVLADALTAKKKVLALLGYGCVRSHAETELLEFAEKFQIPFITTMDAKGVIREDHPLSLGMPGTCGDAGAKQAFKEAELVLAIGNSFAKWDTWKFEPGIYDDKTLLHINIQREEIGKVYPTDYGMVADVKSAVKALTEALSAKNPPVEKKTFVKDKIYQNVVEYSGDKIHPGALCRELSKHLPERSIVLGDAGANMIWLAAYMEFTKGQNYKNPGSFGPMASHVNAAIGVQLANPDRRVIVGCGDGDYEMSGFEILTAIQNRIPIIWIILNNSEFGIIKLFNLATHGKEVFNHIICPDFAKYAEACGANGYRVEKLEDFSGAFQSALASDKPSIIDVIIDPDPVMPFKFWAED